MKVLWDGTFGFSSLFEKTRNMQNVQPLVDASLHGSTFFSSFSKTLSVVLVWPGLISLPPAQQTGILPTEPERLVSHKIYSACTIRMQTSAFRDKRAVVIWSLFGHV